MTPSKFSLQSNHIPPPVAGELITDFRGRIAAIQAETMERRRKELAEQASTLNSPATRIRIWEKLHELALPHARAHPLMVIIATHTGLTVEQVREEQDRRVASAPSAGQATKPLER